MAPPAVTQSPGQRAGGSGGRRVVTAPTAAGDVPPNQTLYCNNLNDKLHKQDLQACLYEFFSAYGLVLEVVVRGTNMRGQAFVVFADLGSATAALRAAQGKDFLGKPLRLQYAKTKSDAILKLNDQFKPRKPNAPRNKVDAGAGSATKAKDGKATGETGQFSLFIENLPPKATKTSLDILFGQYRGHTESRLIEGRGVAFVDFSTQAQAAVAMQGMQGFKVDPSHPIKISMVEK
ncbi:small nuclear ribonucleoprotein [Toxoplasma gondii TgCatPRC2]|uniref:Small nuclear ribonucleoprotein n=14 Tax=Toxoplasma gondii TaxID=5811 RepID=A0A0F7UPB4_TOXGV|nr:small nuclear ribonucleoprotein [Toxoplasma gondii ME49]EPR57868.1 small nuclear ribonucleoprotein [Toxoplasma gondii GT1]ESS29500.1 small nuclear ribonucleoprotein [Toxoplasma gondii VEG]KAF4645873.1 small nuclear ribonucleoprotein [Toxoplasma gondii]KFG29196.1 small nuclear ribonucleoprotein [Toxoplasma gondii p89]KFG34806.1 small nuclear ribonucleoprotein [Toxoplasma gondii GAB2-2007-GAL-DOM2]KFG49754.1 small nuclear ribonucleoprotein [Toxoplasma gondii FOU]KFH05488.1 small nuclear rib|eukprot:XP_002369718.1 small nuclear ribonucleoprotein [Toxoplasma gondii ME49]